MTRKATGANVNLMVRKEFQIFGCHFPDSVVYIIEFPALRLDRKLRKCIKNDFQNFMHFMNNFYTHA